MALEEDPKGSGFARTDASQQFGVAGLNRPEVNRGLSHSLSNYSDLFITIVPFNYVSMQATLVGGSSHLGEGQVEKCSSNPGFSASYVTLITFSLSVTSAQPTGSHAPSTLVEEWRAASVQNVWLRPGDWYTPAVDALAEAIEGGLDTAPSAFRLGEARAAAGVGITEAIDDLAIVFKAAGYEESPIRSVRSLCEGWTGGNPAVRTSGGMTDAESGLGTIDYLVQRLVEVYGAAKARGDKVTETHALVIVDVSVVDSDVWQRIARNAAVGAALKGAYGDGHPMAHLRDGVYGVLVKRGESLGKGIATLRENISEKAQSMRVGNLTRQPPRVWVEALPESHGYAVELLMTLQR